MGAILIPLPETDFDPTEVATPWRIFRQAGFEVIFATPEGGRAPACDPLTLAPVVFGQLGARPVDVAVYRELEADPAFQAPLAYAEVREEGLAALSLPGGHAPGMRPYLEATALQDLAGRMLQAGRPVGAICHGTVVLARATVEGRPALAGRRVTGLPLWMEWASYALTFWKLGRHYRTYPAYVETEVRAALGPEGVFERGPLHNDFDRPFVVEDGALITARWPGDAARYAERLVALIRSEQGPVSGAAAP